MDQIRLLLIAALLPAAVVVGNDVRAQDSVVALALGEDGGTIAAARNDGGIVIVGVGDLRESRTIARFTAPMKDVTQLAFVAAGDKLALAGSGFALCDVRKGQITGPKEGTLLEAPDADLALAIAADGERVAVQWDDQTVHVIDARDGTTDAVLRFGGNATPRPVAFSCDGRRVLILTGNGHRWSWDWSTAQEPDLRPRIPEVIGFFDQRNDREVVVKSRGVEIGDRAIFLPHGILAAATDRNRTLLVLRLPSEYLALDAGGDELFRIDPSKQDLPPYQGADGARGSQPFALSANGAVLAFVVGSAEVAVLRHGKFEGRVAIR